MNTGQVILIVIGGVAAVFSISMGIGILADWIKNRRK